MDEKEKSSENHFFNPPDPEEKETCFNCAHKPDPFLQEELEIFSMLRLLKEEARGLKGRLKVILSDEKTGERLPALLREEKRQCEERLGQLHREWEGWKQKSLEACRRRMIALGHLKPGE